MAGGRNAVHAHRDAASRCNFSSDLGSGQHAAVARLGTLTELELNHLDLWIGGVGDEFLFAECAVRVAAAKVAGGHFPNQVTAMHAVVLTDRAFTRVVNESAHPGTLVQRLNGVARQRAKAHCRDIEDAGVIGAAAGLVAFLSLLWRASNPHAKVVGAQFGRLHGVVDPLIALLAHIKLGTKRAVIHLPLGALIDQ